MEKYDIKSMMEKISKINTIIKEEDIYWDICPICRMKSEPFSKCPICNGNLVYLNSYFKRHEYIRDKLALSGLKVEKYCSEKSILSPLSKVMSKCYELLKVNKRDKLVDIENKIKREKEKYDKVYKETTPLFGIFE